MAPHLNRALRWIVRHTTRMLIPLVVRTWGKTLTDSALGTVAEVVPARSPQVTQTQVFNVSGPVTVYVRGSHCAVQVSRHEQAQVIVEANLQRAFGVELVATQDEKGVYVVVKRKPIVGTVTRARLTLTVPPDSYLALHLTPGQVSLQAVDGLIELQTNQFFPHSSD